MTRSRGTQSQQPEWTVPPQERNPHEQYYAEYDPRTGAAHPNYAHSGGSPAQPPHYTDQTQAQYAAGYPSVGGGAYGQGHTGNPADTADAWHRQGMAGGQQPHYAPSQAAGDDPAGGYHYPTQQPGAAHGAPDYFGAQTPPPYQPSAGNGQANFAPEFDTYPQAYADNQAGYATEPDPTQSLSGFPRSSYAQHDEARAAQPGLRGGSFDHSPADGAYELGGAARPAPSGGNPGWTLPEPTGHTNPADHQPYMQLRHDAGQMPRYAEHPHAADQFGNAPFGSPYDGGQYNPIAAQENEYESEFEDHEDEDDYQRGSRGKILLIAALVGSIAIGGGVAYGYNTLFSVPSGDSGTPVVKADGGPARVAPTDPGGRKFPDTDSGVLKKMAKRLPATAAGGTTSDETSPDGNRTKVVTTMTFDRQGRLVVNKGTQPVEPGVPGTAQPQPPAKTPSGSDQPLPGLTIMNGNAFGPAVQPNSAPPAAARPPEVRPKVVDVTTAQPPPPQLRTGRSSPGAPPLPTRAPGDQSGAGGAQPQPEPEHSVTAIVRPVQPRSQPSPAPTQRARPPVQAPPGVAAANGYVAVLATKKTRIDALKSFADLQQKYASVLGKSIPAVQVADLRSRGLGRMYRAVVGPPGSRQSAQKVCSRLRSAGYRSCWVKSF
jgi:SPOR domain